MKNVTSVLLLWGVTIAISWLVWILVYWPGSMFWDMAYELSQYYGRNSLHLHPPFATLIMGVCFDLGIKIFKSENIGLFLYILLQYLILLFACICACKKALELTDNKKLVILSISFYAFFPLFGATVQCGMKDSISYALVLLSFLTNVEIVTFIKRKRHIELKTYISFLTFAFLSCLYRKEMIYIYTLVLLVNVGYAIKRNRGKWLIWYMLVSMSILQFSTIFQNNIVAEGIFGQSFEQGNTESYSIPLQHLARYVYFYDSELSEDEKRIIGECFTYGYDGIKSNYNPNLSDPIKYNFDTRVAEENGFWTVYKRIIERKPFLFVESVLASSYGYLSIVPNVPTTINDAPTNGLPGGRVPCIIVQNIGDTPEDQGFWITRPEKLQSIRQLMTNYMEAFQLPYNVLYSFGFYTWLVVLLFVISVLRNGLSGTLNFVIPVLLILVCVASPVNDYGRYYMGIIYIVPVLVSESITNKTVEDKIDG